MFGKKFTTQFALLTLTLITLTNCQDASTSGSHLKIRSGSEVTWQQQGPEAKSTVGLIVRDRYGRESTCSSALIGPDVLLTAAHCIYGIDGIDGMGQVTAFFGLDRDTAIARRQLIPAVELIAHPDYQSLGMEIAPHDIAVIRLRSEAPVGYEPIALASRDSTLEPGAQVLLAGYGITEIGNDSGTLRYTLATYVGKDELGRLEINDLWRRGACSGDSGGPLFTTVNGRHEVAGVLSGGPIPCRGVNFYTSVAEHLDFIKSL